MNKRGVAQLARAPALGAGGRWFKSSHPDHFLEMDLVRRSLPRDTSASAVACVGRRVPNGTRLARPASAGLAPKGRRPLVQVQSPRFFVNFWWFELIFVFENRLVNGATTPRVRRRARNPKEKRKFYGMLSAFWFSSARTSWLRIFSAMGKSSSSSICMWRSKPSAK
jgi:hypothetical protein